MLILILYTNIGDWRGFMETNLSLEEIKSSYRSFHNLIKDDVNKIMLINTLENHIKGNQWPKDYYKIRDEVIPAIFGLKFSRFFFWVTLGGLSKMDREKLYFISEEDTPFLNYLQFNYSETFIKAKKYNVNPLGYYGVHFTHGSKKELFNMYLTRNDDTQFLMRANSHELMEMVTEITYFYSNMLLNNAIDIENEMEFSKQLGKLQRSIWFMIEQLKEEYLDEDIVREDLNNELIIGEIDNE